MDLSEVKNLVDRYRADTSDEVCVECSAKTKESCTECFAKAKHMPGLSVFEYRAPGTIEPSIYEPALCVILQGSKTASIGDQTVTLLPGDALIVSHVLPVVSQITKASRQEPYLALVLFIDLSLMRSLFDQIAEMSVPRAEGRSLAVATIETAWLAPLMRYIELAAFPADARVLGPTTLREIYYRLLHSRAGGMLWSLLNENSHASKIAKAISQLRSGYRMPLRVAELARTAAMSASSFHQQFKAVTGTTPLQFQKDLRLTEAHALLKALHHNVSEVAYAVGYESPNQFSRDYSRKFGATPSTRAGNGASKGFS
jgi:AraC-like DNA-binding protein